MVSDYFQWPPYFSQSHVLKIPSREHIRISKLDRLSVTTSYDRNDFTIQNDHLPVKFASPATSS